jgi:hypothetical protein
MTQPAPNPAPTPGDPAPAPTDPTPANDIPAGDKRTILAELAAERDKRQAMEKQLSDLAPFVKQVTDLAPLAKLAQALGGPATGDTKTDLEMLTERLAEHEKTLGDERSGRWRAEIAHEKGLTAAQAKRLQGSTREELEADADDLLATFPTAPAGPRTPAPDPSQGARGGQPGPDLDAQIREAQTKNDWRTVISLQNQKLANK